MDTIETTLYIYIGQIDKVVKVDTVDMRERNEDKHKYRQIGRQIDGQREREIDRGRGRDRDKQRYTQIYIYIKVRQTNQQSYKQTNRQIDK